MFSLVIRTILHYRHVLLPVIAGVSVAGAVIIGALIVGDSVRGSLRHIAMDRIGAIDHVLLAPRWFSPSIVDHTDKAVELHEVVFVQQVTAKQELRVDDKQVVHRFAFDAIGQIRENRRRIQFFGRIQHRFDDRILQHHLIGHHDTVIEDRRTIRGETLGNMFDFQSQVGQGWR